MRTQKRLLAAILLLSLALTTACSSAPNSNTVTQGKVTGNLNSKSPVTVTLWHYYVGENQQALESAVSAFNQTIGIEKGVIVEAVAKGSIAELEAGVTASAMGVINSQPMPQIFSSYPDKAMEIDGLEMVTDLSPYFTAEERALYVEDFLSDGIFAGDRLLLVPIVKSTELLYLNATGWNAFAEVEGYDASDLSTWEALYETARAYHHWTDALTPDVPWDGKALMGFDSVANFIIIGCKQLGVDVIDAAGGEAGQARLDKAALRRVFDLYYKGMTLGYFGAIGKFRSDDIKAGNLLAYVGSSSSAAYFPTWIQEGNARVDINFLALPYPVLDGGEAYAIQQGAGMCVAKSTPAQQEGAVLFLKWFTDSAQNIDFAMTTGYLPVQDAAYASDAFTSVLEGLRSGDEAEQNVAAVYEIALRQITESNTYAARPFAGSYDVRSVLQSTLLSIAAEDMDKAAALKAEEADEDAILAALDVDARFDAWLAAMRDALTAAKIAIAE